MDNVSFPSRLLIIYDLETEKTGFRPAQMQTHTHTSMHEQNIDHRQPHILPLEMNAQKAVFILPAILSISHYPLSGLTL